MDARTRNSCRKNLIVRFALLVAIGVLSYAQPRTGLGQEPCEVTTPLPGITCAVCDLDGDDCWGAACCIRTAEEEDEDFTVGGVMYKCATGCGCGDEVHDTCEETDP